MASSAYALIRRWLVGEGGHLLVVEASGPNVDRATTGNSRLPFASNLTGPAKRHSAPGFGSWEFVAGICLHSYNRSTMPLRLPGMDWGRDLLP